MNIFPEKSKNSWATKISLEHKHRTQADDSIMCGYFCIGFIDFMLTFLLDYTNLFSHKEYEKNYEIILKYFQ